MFYSLQNFFRNMFILSSHVEKVNTANRPQSIGPCGASFLNFDFQKRKVKKLIEIRHHTLLDGTPGPSKRVFFSASSAFCRNLLVISPKIAQMIFSADSGSWNVCARILRWAKVDHTVGGILGVWGVFPKMESNPPPILLWHAIVFPLLFLDCLFFFPQSAGMAPHRFAFVCFSTVCIFLVHSQNERNERLQNGYYCLVFLVFGVFLFLKRKERRVVGWILILTVFFAIFVVLNWWRAMPKHNMLGQGWFKRTTILKLIWDRSFLKRALDDLIYNFNYSNK